MKGKRLSTKEKLGIALLGLSLWIQVIALGFAVGFDLWISKSATSGDSIWLIGLWRVCQRSAGEKIYWLGLQNCTVITDSAEISKLSAEGNWSSGLELLSLVFIGIAGFMTILSHIFFLCGYIPKICCKTCGKASLPAVLFSSGAAQIGCLVSIYYMADQEGEFGLSYYLTAANLLPTWLSAVATAVVTCIVN
ncbi:hypothetical protein EB796_017290 [Bugula neritina]|uniref:Uncharacterized protein n=1 Tax=Bugula neritina TaxID=10212 RepID=A0A7J7JG80_BUGNE|nr:hypothetical protein EB796_017290 [Bugula neritina]